MNDVKFTGAIEDQSAGLYYMNARFYNPTSGRFISQDSYSGSPSEPWTQHLYSYTCNNPVNMIDPTGHMPQYICFDDNDYSVNLHEPHYLMKNGIPYQPRPYEPDDARNVPWYIKGAGMAGAGACVLLLYAGMFGAVYGAGEAGSAVAALPILPKIGNFFGKIASGTKNVFGKIASGTKNLFDSIFGDEADKVADKAEGQGYESFNALKKAIGSPGEGNQWHHIVEQSQITKSGFTSFQINNTDNIIAIDKATHAQISGYYNTTTFDFTNGLSVRNWLVGQSFESQYDFGINILNRFGVTK